MLIFLFSLKRKTAKKPPHNEHNLIGVCRQVETIVGVLHSSISLQWSELLDYCQSSNALFNRVGEEERSKAESGSNTII